MTKSPVTASNAIHTKAGSSDKENSHRLSVRSPSPTRKPSPSNHSPNTVSANDLNVANRRAFAHNGDIDALNGHDESEAETVHLSDTEHKRKRTKKTAIKAEDDDDDTSSRLSTSSRQSRRSSSAADRVNGSSHIGRSERNGRRTLANGNHHGERGHAKSSSPSNRSDSKRSVASSELARNSPSADETTSPTVVSSERGRASSVGGTRKRKIRDEHYLRNIEPPRQRLKSDPAGKIPATQSVRGGPNSPTLSAPGLRSHKRSASTQSLIAGAQSRRRREASAAHERKQWRSDTSSEASSSPQPTTPAVHYSQATRTKRSSHRSMTSPARNAQMGHPKKNVDKFGATRLAREGEKGNLEAVHQAYDAAPEELDQSDFAGFAPIQKAALNGHADVVEFLLKKGCRTDCQSKEHDTPLIDAVENGHLDVVRLLLDAGVNPHHQNKKGERAVDVLNQEEDNVDEIENMLRKAMLEHASDDDVMSTDLPLTTRDLVTGEHRNDLLYVESTLSNLRKYAAKGDAVAVDHFLSSIAPDTACVTGAARGGHEMVLNLLLAMPSDRMEKDPDPAKHNETPLTAAIGRGHLGILRILLDQDNFNPTRRNKEAQTYFELAEERKGPKWQQEVDLLKERYDAYRARRQAQKKRSLGSHAAEKASKVTKLRSPRSPETRRTARTSPPVPSTETREGRMQPPKIKQEKSADAVATAPLKKMRSVDGVKSSDAVKHARRSEDHPSKARRRRVVDEDSSEDDDDHAPPKKIGRSRRISEVSSSSRREPHATANTTAATVKGKHRERRASASTRNDKENKQKHQHAEDEEMVDAPLPLPAAVIETVNVKQSTPEPIRRGRIHEPEIETNRQRMAADRARLAEEQKAAEVIAAKQHAERQARMEQLPTALRHACEKREKRPLHFSANEVGISMTFLPLQVVPHSHLSDDAPIPDEEWIMSFQAVGILGLKDPNVLLSHPTWQTKPVTTEQRTRFLKSYDISLLAQDSHLPSEDDASFDPCATDRAVLCAREKFLAMPDLCWVRVADLEAAVMQSEWLRGLTLTKCTVGMRPTGADTPRSLEELIQGIVRQHQQALLTPSSGTQASPQVGSVTAARGSAAGEDAMDVDQAPGSSGIV